MAERPDPLEVTGEFADYICVDRTTLSTELTILANEGVLKSRKNHFELNPPHEAPDPEEIAR